MSEGRVRLRPIREADLPDYVVWFNHPEVTQFTAMESGEFTLEGEQEWFRKISDPEHEDKHWAIEVDGRHIGNCALILGRYGDTGAFGIVIGERSAWGKGYGTAALREVLRAGFAELKLHRIHLDAFADNARGIRCYEKCGFRREGLCREARWKRGEWRDVVRMAILREEWEAQQITDTGAGLTIRSFRMADYQSVAALWEAAGLPPRPSDRREEIVKKLDRDPDLFLVAAAHGEIVGAVIGGWDGRRGWVYRMAVHPDYQRQGMGTTLMRELESRFRVKGALAVNLIYNTGNTGAQAFYLSLGYEYRDDIKVMGRDLASERDGGGECARA